MNSRSDNSDLRIVMAQLDFLVGAVDANADKVLAACVEARDELAANVIVFPELTLTGYPPEDLLLRPHFIGQVEQAVERLRGQISGITAVIGYPLRENGALFNVAAVIQDGDIIALYRKQHLPNYGVFDEKRYFESGTEPCVVSVAGASLGITICEDIWVDGPACQAADAGAAILVNINASPFHTGKRDEREEMLARRARNSGLPVVYVNLVGGQDELVFDGGSFVVDAARQAKHGSAETVLVDIVAHPQHQCSVYRLDFRQQRHLRTRERLCAGGEIHRVQTGLAGRCVLRHRAGGIDNEGAAIKDQFILATDQVYVHDRQTAVARTTGKHFLALVALAGVKG